MVPAGRPSGACRISRRSAARRVADGARKLEAPRKGARELTDLGASLEEMTARLRATILGCGSSAGVPRAIRWPWCRNSTSSSSRPCSSAVASHGVGAQAQTPAAAASASGERKVLYWYDPMAPATKFDKPGRSPFMDMELVPKYADEVEGGERSTLETTGENLVDAQAGFDSQTQEPTVNLTLDAKGARIFRDVTRESVGKRMAILLFEKGKGEVVTAPVIRSEIGGGRVQISGRMSTVEANDVALLLRAGSLAAPMEIIEERTIGPSLGAENIAKGFNSVTWGFAAVAVFMCVYYMLFGLFSSIALGVNLLLLVAVLSMLQATLTLPGMAAMALVLGMAIDANVLINERVREELRNGSSPQSAIHAGYERAWATILDSNVTTLIAGLALLAFGSGPVRGFAVVHCLGILTSMFSAVFFSRGLVNLWYGRQKRLSGVSIGTVWRPGASASDTDNPPTTS